MSLFTWLFGKVTRQPSGWSSRNEERQVPSSQSIQTVNIRSRNFVGLSAGSPNRRYTLAWRDANESGKVGGFRESGYGRYILLDGERIVAEAEMARPNDGKVADNGNFILHDWGFGGSLKGTFSAFRADGKRILSRHFKANLLNNGLSPDGVIAVCHTCNSDSETDSAILAVFDLAKGVEMASWRPESGWPTYYEFPEEGTVIRLGYPRLGSFAFTLTGDFIDRERWIEAALDEGNLYLVERLLKEADTNLPTEFLAKLIRSIDHSLAGAVIDARTRAYGLKLKGRCLDSLASLDAALDCYDQALALDPKIGVKRRADQIRKSATAPDTNR
jgi:hypothetical protein